MNICILLRTAAFIIIAFSTSLLAKVLFSWTIRIENPLIHSQDIRV